MEDKNGNRWVYPSLIASSDTFTMFVLLYFVKFKCGILVISNAEKEKNELSDNLQATGNFQIGTGMRRPALLS